MVKVFLNLNLQKKKNKNGSVMILMNNTRFDIAYVMSSLSRYTHNSNKEHWTALNHLLRYFRGTMHFCLHFNNFLVVLEGYCDTNWV